MEFIAPILNIVVSFFSLIFVLRVWMQFCRVDIHLPISQTLLRLTSPILDPMSKFIPTVARINLAGLLIAMLIVAIKYIIVGIDPLISLLIGFLSVFKTFGTILFFTTMIRALMSWVTQGNHPLDYLIAQLTEPVLGKIRRILPRTGMLDFSVMVLALVLMFLNSMMYQFLGNLWLLA